MSKQKSVRNKNRINVEKYKDLDPDIKKLFEKWDNWTLEEEKDRIGNPNHPDLIVYDGLCGTGKTTSAYNLINVIHERSDTYNLKAVEESETRAKPIPSFIFVAPTIMECHRVAGSIPVDIPNEYEGVFSGFETSGMMENDEKINKEQRVDLNGNVIYLKGKPTKREFVIPSFSKKHTSKNKNTFRTRLESIKYSIKRNQDIAITHAAFLHFDQELIKLINEKSTYHLIIDEAPNTFGNVTDVLDKEVTSNDINNLIIQGNIVVGENDVVSWKKTKTIKKWDVFKVLKKYIDEKRIIHYSLKGNILFIRSIPELYKSFKSVRILTYLFEGSICKSYFELYGIKYVIRNFKGNLENPIKYWELIELANSKNPVLNSLDKRSLSYYWFEKKKYEELEFLRNATSSFFKNKCKDSTSEKKLWTCYKGHIEKCESKGYKNSWLHITARGTNLYKQVDSLAYLVSRHPNTPIKNYFLRKSSETRNLAIKINEDKYATGELIQWVFRSQIRDEKPIKLFLPSLRMRNLLELWFIDMGKPGRPN